MARNLAKIDPRVEDAWRVVVESPRGATVKLVYDPELDAFEASRPLPLGLRYPYDWGFVPGTRAPDGDPVDALVLWDVASFPGTVIACRLVGVVELEQRRKDRKGLERNDRVLAVPVVSARDDLEGAFELSERARKEIAHFFVAVTELEGKEPKVLGFRGPEAAVALVRSSMKKGGRAAA